MYDYVLLLKGSTLELLLKRTTLLWVMPPRLGFPHFTSAWEGSPVLGATSQPGGPVSFFSSSAGGGTDGVCLQLCPPPQRAFGMHTPFIQVHSDSLLYFLIPFTCVEEFPHASSLFMLEWCSSATPVLRSHRILFTYTVVLHRHGTCQTYVCAHMHGGVLVLVL